MAAPPNTANTPSLNINSGSYAFNTSEYNLPITAPNIIHGTKNPIGRNIPCVIIIHENTNIADNNKNNIPN